jgi:hypothetical protein
MAHQWPAAQKRAGANLVVENGGSLADLDEALRRAVADLAAWPDLVGTPAGPFLAGVLEAWHGRP